MITLFETVNQAMEKIIKDFVELLPELETNEETQLTNREKALLLSAIEFSLEKRLKTLSDVKKHKTLYNPYVIKAYQDDYETLKSLIDKLELGVK